MKTKLPLAALVLALTTISYPLSTGHAATTINPANPYAYGANVGWINARGDTANGAVIGEYVCSGYLWAANIGWIRLGRGTPANGIQYQNSSATDYGVNHDGTGKLSGYAYGANIGWIVFEPTYGQPKVNLLTGKFSGSVYSANCGWISLSNAVAHVQTDSIAPGADTDGDGLADAWELTYTNSLTAFTGLTDTDGDGVPDAQEYQAGTSPLDPNDLLKITAFQRNVAAPSYNQLGWHSKPTRLYTVQTNSNLGNNAGWVDALYFSSPGVSATGFFDYNPTNQFYRIRAYRPLMP